MNIFSKTAVAAFVALACTSGLTAPEAGRVGRYDFAYQISGDPRARPVQVFDDGVGRTYFQFRPGEPIPVLFVGEGTRVLYPKAEGPYYVVDVVARQFTLCMGMSRGSVTHASVVSGMVKPSDSGAETRPVLLASAGRGLPEGALPRASNNPESRGDWTSNSYATPVRGDAVDWTTERPREATVSFAVGDATLSRDQAAALAALAKSLSMAASPRVEILASDDDSLKERVPSDRAAAIKSALVKGGVPSQSIAIVPTGVPPQYSGVGKRRTVTSLVRWFSSSPMQRPTSVTTQLHGLGPDAVRLLVDRGFVTAEQASRYLLESGKGTSLTATANAAGAGREALEFDLRKSDKRMSASLIRWGKASGFEVLWESPHDPDLIADKVLSAREFKGAVRELVEGLKDQGYPIRARIYADNVVRFYSQE